MDRIEVSSSNIISVGYDEDSMTLEVEFIYGRLYQYYGVPEGVYQQFLSAESHGGFLNAYIRGKYPFERLS